MQDSLDLGNLPYETPAYMSPSSIGTFNQCPMRYKYAKLDRIPEDSTEAQVLGSFVHEVLEEFFKEDKIGQSQLLDGLLENFGLLSGQKSIMI